MNSHEILRYIHLLALSRGADILSESFIFFVSGAIVVYEYHRSSEKEKKKEAARLQKIRDDASILQAKLVSLDKRLEALEEYAKANRKSILGLDIGANYKNPENVVPIDDDGGVLSEMTGGTVQATPSSNSNDVEAIPARNKDSERQAPKGRWYWPFR